MGEKETAGGAGAAAAKQAPEKKNEEQRYVQDDTPEGESTARKHDTAMSSIQNIR